MAARHPFAGIHNHAHDDGRGGVHTHAHMHDDDDVHEHVHLMGKDARMLSPEERQQARVLYAADKAAHPGATKAARVKAAAPASLGQLASALRDALQRIEALSKQTTDGPDTPARSGPPGDFLANIRRPADPSTTGRLPMGFGQTDLHFGAVPDLVKREAALVAEAQRAVDQLLAKVTAPPATKAVNAGQHAQAVALYERATRPATSKHDGEAQKAALREAVLGDAAGRYVPGFDLAPAPQAPTWLAQALGEAAVTKAAAAGTLSPEAAERLAALPRGALGHDARTAAERVARDAALKRRQMH